MTQILKSMNPINIISQKDGAKRTAIMFLSILLMGFAVSVFSYSGMGVDPFTALNMSISAKLGVSFGLFQMCMNGAILVLVALTSKVLSDKPLFFLINSYTTGLSPLTMSYIVDLRISKVHGGKCEASEIALPVKYSGGFMPCGASARWQEEK